MSVTIERISIDDLPVLETFLKNAGSSLISFRYFDRRPLSVIANHIVTAILSGDEGPIGYGHLDKDGDRVWLGIAIIEKASGKGYGRMMMDFLVSEATQLKLKELYLTVDNDNRVAVRLYEKYGFGVVKNVNERSVLMLKQL